MSPADREGSGRRLGGAAQDGARARVCCATAVPWESLTLGRPKNRYPTKGPTMRATFCGTVRGQEV